MMQKTDFDFEVIIGEDCSLDNTREIVKEFEQKYPNIIKPVYRDKNIGVMQNLIDILCRAKGEYIAYCDGDDYWTDPYKLQKQVDFLEEHNDYVLCAGKSLIRDGNNFREGWSPKTETVSFKDIAHSNAIITNTVVFRNIFRDNELSKIYNYLNKVVNGDIFIFLSLLMKGKGYILQDCIGVYRMHDGAVHSKKPDKERYLLSLKTRNIIIEYLKDINADDSYIKDVEHGYLFMFESYLNNNMLTEEFMEIIPKPILNKVINKLMNNYQRQKEQLQLAGSFESLVAERDAALAAVVAIRHSKSWRLTAPLRLLGHLVKGFFPAAVRAIAHIKKWISKKLRCS
jgi:glycosyltransferase involved in cell wall biosynthesis